MASDPTGTGDTHGIIAQILEEHDAHHGGAETRWVDGEPRCHAIHSHMAGAPSDRVRQTVEGIINNASRGTAEQAQWAKWWHERNVAAQAKPTETEL